LSASLELVCNLREGMRDIKAAHKECPCCCFSTAPA